jgi:serine protease Do
VEGLGFAIPSSMMKRLVNDLLVYGEIQPEPMLGLMVMTVGTQLTDTLWGAEVDSVTKGSAAERAGVQKGDYIIAAGNVKEILNSNDVLRARREFHVGDQMPMTLWRDGEIVEVILDLQEAVE